MYGFRNRIIYRDKHKSNVRQVCTYRVTNTSDIQVVYMFKWCSYIHHMTCNGVIVDTCFKIYVNTSNLGAIPRCLLHSRTFCARSRTFGARSSMLFDTFHGYTDLGVLISKLACRFCLHLKVRD